MSEQSFRQERFAREHNQFVKFLKAFVVFVMVWPVLGNLLGHAWQAFRSPIPFTARTSFDTAIYDALMTILMSYFFGLLPAVIVGASIVLLQLRYRFFNTVHIVVIGLIVGAIIPPILFVDKDSDWTDVIAGGVATLVSTLMCWMLVRRWLTTPVVAGGQT